MVSSGRCNQQECITVVKVVKYCNDHDRRRTEIENLCVSFYWQRQDGNRAPWLHAADNARPGAMFSPRTTDSLDRPSLSGLNAHDAIHSMSG